MSAGTITRDGPPPTFTLFPNLPAELRIKIWRYSLPGPRIIEAAYHDLSFSFNGAHPPPVFQACRDSRNVALSVYKPLFKSAMRKDRFKTLPHIYINPAHDTVYISTPYGHGEFVYPEFAQRYPDITSIQSVVVDISNSNAISAVLTDVLSSSSESLREIVLVDEFSSSHRIYGLKEPDIVFVEPGPWSVICYPRARDIGAALCPDVCIKVMAVKTLWVLAHSSEGLTEGDETYDSDSDH